PVRLSPVTERIASNACYLIVTLVLLFMTAGNIGLAFVDLHGFNTLVGLLIAGAELLVMSIYFMHLRWSAAMTRLVGLAALMLLSILWFGPLDDLLTRGWLPVPGK